MMTLFLSMCDAMMTYIQVRDITFQRLIYEDSPYTQLVWLIGELGSIPMGAIIGSHAQDGAPLYVISVEGIPGCYDARNQFVEYEEYGAQQTSEFKYLALVFGVYTPVSFVMWYLMPYTTIKPTTYSNVISVQFSIKLCKTNCNNVNKMFFF